MDRSGNFIPVTLEDLQKGVEHNSLRNEFPEGIEETASKQCEPKHAECPGDPINPGDSLVRACQLTSDEMTSIKREMEAEQPEHPILLEDNLVEILLHLNDDRAYDTMISYFEKKVEASLERKDLEQATALLRSLHGAKECVEERQKLAIRRILETASTAYSIELLGRCMRGNGEVDTEPVLQYLRFLTKRAIDPLSRLLVELEPGKWRKLVSDFLSELSQDDIHPLTKFLSDRDPILVCHILNVLGKIGHPSTVRYLGEVITHENLKVREVALQVLAQFGEKGTNLIQRFLTDKAAEIRSTAAVLFGRFAKGQAVGPLASIIFSEGFYTKDYDERASFIRALGETGSHEAIPLLKKMAKKKFWFGASRWNETRSCAAHAIERMETEMARQVAQHNATDAPRPPQRV